MTFNQIYTNLLQECWDQPITTNERTGAKVKQIFGVNFKLNPTTDFPLTTLRPVPIKAGWLSEVIWFLIGTDKMDFLNQNKNKFWNEFLDNNGNCPYNYGAIWQNSFGRNQMDSLLNSLQNEPSSRQNVITIWNGSKDGLDSPKQANVPCITQFQVSISNNKLYLHTYWRSEDLGLGFVNDVPAFAMLQMFLAQKLGLEVGELIWTIHNAHIYENQFENVKEMIYRHNELEQDIGYLILPYDNKEEMVEYYYTRYNCLYNIEAFNIINFNPISFSLNELPAHCFDICYQQPNLDKAQIVLAEIFGIIKSKYNPLAKLAKMEIVK